MRQFLFPVAMAATLAACSSFDEPAAVDVVARFHTALNAGDWPGIDGLLTQSTRNLRPGSGTARAFRNIITRHGRYMGGELAGIDGKDGRITIAWAARFEKGPVSELFVLVDEGGTLKIDSYTDNAVP
jgi:hypothetical protein